ncbi:MAG: Wzz/FepE/Etk N-terminal domain-containing protein [Clostridia bacterium]|nr:Wzz/FepE/Etk N-terminal domain-containing protein [Clostridia bacterium]
MDKSKASFEDNTIDLLHLAKVLWKNIWVIAVCALIFAIIGLSYAAFFIAPTYSSFVKLYVNNKSLSLGSTSISIADINASQSLLKTYGDILKSRSTLERIIDKADLDCNWKQLSGMISYSSSNNTEIMKVNVTCTDPYLASKIANTVAEVLPVRIAEIIDGASMEVVDTAIPDLQKLGPSLSKYTMIGGVIGLLLSAGVIVLLSVLDDTIYDEQYVIEKYDYPILGYIPDSSSTNKKSYKYYKSYEYHSSAPKK